MNKIIICFLIGIFILLVSCAAGFAAGDEAVNPGTAGTETAVADANGTSPTSFDKAVSEAMNTGAVAPEATAVKTETAVSAPAEAVETEGAKGAAGGVGAVTTAVDTVGDAAASSVAGAGGAVVKATQTVAAPEDFPSSVRYVTLSKPGKDVFVKFRSGWVPAEDGMVILPGDEVRTAPGSSVEVILDGGKVGHIEVKGGSLFTVLKAEIDPVTGDKKTLLDLAVGKIMVKAGTLTGNSKFEVQTPSAVTGVRGTLFEVEVEGKLKPMAD